MDGLSRAVKKGIFAFALSVLVSVSANADLPPLPPGILLNTWPFDATNLVTSKGNVPRGFSDVDLVPSWHSNAVRIPGPVALLQYNEIDTNAVTNIVCDSGTVMFWFSPLWNSGAGPGVFGRLLEMGQYTTNASFGWWSLYLDPSGSWVHFGSHTNGAGSNYLTAPINWQSNTWHHVGLTYSPTNSALYVDGQLATNGAGVGFYPGPIARWTNGLAIGSDTSGGNVANGLFDRMLTFNYPVAGNFISNTYQRTIQIYGGGDSGDSLQSAPGGEGLMNGGESGEESGASSQGLTLGIVAAGSNVRLILYGTVPDTVYSIYSKPTLTSTTWTFEKNVTGATGQDWTDTLIPMNGRQMLFLRAGSTSDDTDGDGLSDAEEIFVTGTDPGNPDIGNTGIADGYKDFDGDQWTNIDEIRNGTNPNGWNAPKPPMSLRLVQFNASSATLEWETADGQPSGYILERALPFLTEEPQESDFLTLASLDSSELQFTDSLWVGDSYPVFYRLRAVYNGGTSEPGPHVSVQPITEAWIVRGPGGRPVLVVGSASEPWVTVKLHRESHDATYPIFDYQPIVLDGGYGVHQHAFRASPSTLILELAKSDFINGTYVLPASFAPNYGQYNFSIQPVLADGSIGTRKSVRTDRSTQRGIVPYLDGSAHLGQNLDFQLRMETRVAGELFRYTISAVDHFPYYEVVGSEDYVAADFLHEIGRNGLNEFRPFQENSLIRNWFYSPQHLSAENVLNTGINDDAPFNILPDAQRHIFDVPSFVVSGSTIAPSAIPAEDVGAPLFQEFESTGFVRPNDAPLQYVPPWPGSYVFLPGTVNTFGLPFNSAVLADRQPPFARFVLPDDEAPAGVVRHFFLGAAVPVRQTVDYYFAGKTGPFPVGPAWDTTQTTPLLIAPCGKPFEIHGWAKQRLVNGAAGKFAYLGQYFDKAYKANPDGTRSSQETGILSEYGEFFPTEPGRTILTTKPDIDTGAVGECTVYVTRLSIDANHNGTMDERFHGADNTSAERPYTFWLNNDNDGLFEGTESSIDKHRDFDDETISSQRDLEDFARLWLSGLPPMPWDQGYSVSLSWKVPQESPTIRLYRAFESDGGTRYVREQGTAQETVQSGFRLAIGTVSPAQSLIISPFELEIYGTKCLLFEGVAPGKGELVLTVQKGTELLAQTSAHFEIKDIKDMYEQVHIENVTDQTPSTLVARYRIDNPIEVSPDEEHSAIIFVHGWRMGQRDYYSFSESMFKRLYWQGFNGRFASVRWPTWSKDDFRLPLADLFTYNKSEFRSFQSGRGLADYFTYLRQRFPDYKINVASHSMGGIITMEALRYHLSLARQDIDNYVLMQAAVPAHCYDVTLANYQPLVDAEAEKPTPDRYRGHPGAISGAAREDIVNFFNVFDYALATGVFLTKKVHWEQNEIDYKPDHGYLFNPQDGTSYKDTRALADAREIMAFVARPRSKAIGALAGVGGEVTGGDVNLNVGFLMGGGMDEHSAQFNWNIQRLWSFYRQLGISLRVIEPPVP